MIRSRMSPRLAALLLSLALAGGGLARAQADPGETAGGWSVSVAEAAEVVRLEGRIEAGRALYAVCAECHYASGIGDRGGTMPQLAGQHRSVLIKQMMDIRAGRRRNPIMLPYLAGLADAQSLADVASYIESLPIPRSNGKGSGVDLGSGRRLYEASCASCHGERGEGSAEAYYPALRGQHYRYLVRQLIDIAGERRGNAHPAMVTAIEDFSARDVAHVADYISRLPVADRRASGGS